MNQSYYIFSSGELRRKDNTLQLIKSDGIKTDIPIERIYDLYVFSEMTINTKLLNFLSEYGVNLHYFNYYEFYSGTFYPRERKVSGKLLVKQVEHYTNPEPRMAIAKEFIEAASYNILRNLRYYNNRGKDLSQPMETIIGLREKISSSAEIHELMGVEGNIRKTYYDTWKIIINQGIDFEKRVKRPPDNMVNSLISFLNTMMYTKVLSEIYHTQINPTISYLHEPGDKRFSLALDIAEIFKPILVDRLIFSLLNKGMISESDFTDCDHFLKLKEPALKKIIKEFEETLKRTVSHKSLNRTVSYRHLIRLEIYKLIKHLLEEKPYEGFKIWW
ncbi:MAG: type I-B CRISPR-associated endonuclease Cas1b [Bacillota bacterium]|nr:type I-B CRISPR-associated endonuclease Cas1b [Bacillota bacterium]